jgi:beta-lactamase class A
VARSAEAEFERDFSDSLARSLERRRRAAGGRSIASRSRRFASLLGRLGLALAAIGLAATTLSGDALDRVGARDASPPAGEVRPLPSLVAAGPAERVVPAKDRVRDAIDYARQRTGLVSVAVIDSDGHLRGWHAERRYVSASVAKAMLLAAELERLRADGLELDVATRALLERMITWSDNEAADAIYARVGDEGLIEVARAAGMRDFSVAGHWSTAQISARDMAWFMFRLHDSLAGADAGFGKGLLRDIVKEQRWGIPDGIAKGWRIYFKGGWRRTELGQLVHQIALVERGGRRMAIAVLTDAQPTHDEGVETARSVAARLAG